MKTTIKGETIEKNDHKEKWDSVTLKTKRLPEKPDVWERKRDENDYGHRSEIEKWDDRAVLSAFMMNSIGCADDIPQNHDIMDKTQENWKKGETENRNI